MPAATLPTINTALLVAGFALVLWGLRIFRIWVGVSGMIAGAAIGGALAAAVTRDQDIAIVGALAGAALGGLAAWPMQRIVVCLVAALTTAVVSAAGAVAFAGSEYVAGMAIAGFLAGGFLSALLYESFVIVAMAFTGSMAVFHALYVPFDVFSGAPETIGAAILAIYAEQFLMLVAGAAVFVGFALWYQRGPARKRERSLVSAASALGARRVSVRLAFLVVTAWIAAAVLVAAGFWPVSLYELVGMHPISWPVVALAAVFVLSTKPVIVTEPGGDVRRARRATRRRRFLRTAAFAAVAPPVLTAGLFVALGGSWTGLVDYYRAFVAGPAPVVAAKWAFSLGLLPLFLFRAHPSVVVTPPAPVEPASAEAAADRPEAAAAGGVDRDRVACDLEEIELYEAGLEPVTDLEYADIALDIEGLDEPDYVEDETGSDRAKRVSSTPSAG